MKKKILVSSLFLHLLLCVLSAQIDSQWRGQNRDGVYPEKNLLKIWSVSGPKLVWSVYGLGKGYSSPAVTGSRVYITGMINGSGYLWAFDTRGKKVWTVAYGPEWDKGHPGARTTPTVVADRIYLMSGYGVVHCIDTSGKRKWSIDMIEKFSARNLHWGMTESLLVDGDRVICTPGGPDTMMVALNRHTGKVLWKIRGNGEKSAYCSPVIVKHGERRLLLTMTGESVVGLNADTGKFLWEMKHRTRHDINPNTPLYHQDHVFTVSGYGTTGSQLFRLSKDGSQITHIWKEKTLDSQMGAAILTGGYIYGSGHKKTGWHCLDWKTGKVQFTAKELGKKGNIIFADGLLYCYGENGEVGLVKPNPNKFDIISSFEIQKGSGPHWAHPVIKKGLLYLRHGDALMVYTIKK